jgi:hypothetical protein
MIQKAFQKEESQMTFRLHSKKSIYDLHYTHNRQKKVILIILLLARDGPEQSSPKKEILVFLKEILRNGALDIYFNSQNI